MNIRKTSRGEWRKRARISFLDSFFLDINKILGRFSLFQARLTLAQAQTQLSGDTVLTLIATYFFWRNKMKSSR